ncbi:hypothetical protein OG322_22710 [Streptomyces sp. NBC_01260]|uniref:hypothetical protein n=1 Tax=unclassified Streptomyces TaxID=2593676 RepID=UPI002889B36A|nr:MULTISPECIES: hypothetical protein [unclassified Streptomyces]WNI31505.1 hypothetical protein RLT59_23960 [Streptomyces sp. ITFR-6]
MDGTGIEAVDVILVWGGAVTVLAGAVVAVWRAVRGALHLVGRVDEFMDDWTGESDRPGVPGRPGVMARVSGIEDRLTAVEHEMYPNSGASLRDAVDLANHRLAQLCPDEGAPIASPPAARPPAATS